MARTLFYKHDGGHLGQHEDWYYLVDNEDGTRHVEYEWDHVSVNGGNKSEGTKTYPLDQIPRGRQSNRDRKAKVLACIGGLGDP